MKENPLLKLQSFGQSIWLDHLRRGMLVSGKLQQLIDEDGLSGVTSNPSIFEKAIDSSHDYDDAIRTLALAGRSAREIYQALTVEDVQRAADVLYPIYENTGGRDGFVSLEISPHLAYHTDNTIAKARELWARLDRANVMIKVPATREGLPAIRQLISEGINVNVTLLFDLLRYREVIDAYLRGMMARAARGQSLEVTSVASFFLNRIDALVDPMLETLMRTGGPQAQIAMAIHGQVAIASARVAYQIFDDIFGGERFRVLAAQGASPQRLVWDSTGTKNPKYGKSKYIETLIGPETVSTLSFETLKTYRDYGDPAPTLDEDGETALHVLHRLSELGINLGRLAQHLEDTSVRESMACLDRVLDIIETKRIGVLRELTTRQVLNPAQVVASA